MTLRVAGPLAVGGVEQPDVSKSMTLNVALTDLKRPWHTLNLPQGSSVTLEGPMKFKSEKPPECMIVGYRKEGAELYNYFSCTDCKINWVCEQCKDSCHKTHDTLPHLQQHRPNFACCYCVKKGLCTIKHKK